MNKQNQQEKMRANYMRKFTSDDSRQEMNISDENNKRFRAVLTAFQLLEDMRQSHAEKKVRMLDVGGRHGIHARFFRSKGLEVDIVDMLQKDEPLTFCGDYMDYHPAHAYDVIWCSHVLEHVPNVGNFLSKMYEDLNYGGYLAVTVPPIREEAMAFVHRSLWNCGLLLLNACLAGFDPQTARLASFGYNVSLIIKKTKPKQEITLKYIHDNFPKTMNNTDIHFQGNIKRYRFTVNKSKVFNTDLNFFEEETYTGKVKIFYYDQDTKERYIVR